MTTERGEVPGDEAPEQGPGQPGNVVETVEDAVDVNTREADPLPPAGPGNALESEDGSEADDSGNRIEGATARAVVAYITSQLASEPEAVVIDADDRGRQLRFRIRVAPEDMGRMIGRRGRVAQAIRTLVRVAGSRDGVDTNVDFVDD